MEKQKWRRLRPPHMLSELLEPPLIPLSRHKAKNAFPLVVPKLRMISCLLPQTKNKAKPRRQNKTKNTNLHSSAALSTDTDSASTSSLPLRSVGDYTVPHSSRGKHAPSEVQNNQYDQTQQKAKFITSENNCKD